ncbi:hypothetical protein BD413DRAFT_669023 [Trametes elegans]|nr:hypothetical protein BD413DRAFT_669023 [Trametes elegans]
MDLPSPATIRASSSPANVKADVVLPDIAVDFTGNATVDAEASIRLWRSAWAFAIRYLPLRRERRRAPVRRTCAEGR